MRRNMFVCAVFDRLGSEETDNLLGKLAEELVPDAKLRPSFKQAAREFLYGELDRINQNTPPPVPEKKFVPREMSVVEFIEREWEEWLDRGLLTKPLLKIHDRKAYDGLMNWLRQNELPDDMDLPTQKEAGDRFLERKFFTADEAGRVVGILSRRP